MGGTAVDICLQKCHGDLEMADAHEELPSVWHLKCTRSALVSFFISPLFLACNPASVFSINNIYYRYLKEIIFESIWILLIVIIHFVVIFNWYSFFICISTMINIKYFVAKYQLLLFLCMHMNPPSQIMCIQHLKPAVPIVISNSWVK